MSYEEVSDSEPPFTEDEERENRFLKAMLRRANATNRIAGWAGPHVVHRTFYVQELDGPTETKTFEEVVAYCDDLVWSGIEPLYTSAERPMDEVA